MPEAQKSPWRGLLLCRKVELGLRLLAFPGRAGERRNKRGLPQSGAQPLPGSDGLLVFALAGENLAG